MNDQSVPEVSKAHPVLTINARGDLVGDLSQVAAETLEKLQTPEAREQMRGMYRKQFSTDRRTINAAVRREPNSEHRDYRHLCPPGMSAKEFRKVRRKYLREQTKSVLKEMRHAGNNADSNSSAVSV